MYLRTLCGAFAALIATSTFAATALAQDATTPPAEAASPAQDTSGGAVPLPTLEVDATKAKTAKKKKSAKKSSSEQPSAAAAPSPTQPKPADTLSEAAIKSPPNSFVANVSGAATKTATPILETPQSISVVTREQLDTRDVKTIVEALQYVPGIYTHPGGKDPRYDQFTIRGFNAHADSVFRDGLKELGSGNNFSLFSSEPYGLERIDVIKGPSSVLYGQVSPGGLIDMVTKRPTEEKVREVVGKFGTNDLFEGAFDLGGAVDPSGEFMFRLTGLVRDADAQLAHFSDFVPDDRMFIAPSFTWKSDENTTFTVLTDFQHDEKGNAFPVPVFHVGASGLSDVTPLPLYLGDPSFNKFEQDQFRLGYQFEHQFNDTFTARQKLRYGEVDLDYRYLTVANLVYAGLTTVQGRVARSIDEETSSFTVDNQLETKVSAAGVRHTILTGLDYQRFSLDSTTYGGTAPSLNLNDPVYGQTVATPSLLMQSTGQTATQLGLYVQEQAKVDNLVLTLGGRYDWASVDTANRITGIKTDADDEAFTWRAGATYLLGFGLAPYASYSESFLPTTGTDYAGNPFDPTTGQQYEAGIKYEFGSELRATLAVFDITQQNVLTLDTVHTDTSLYSCAPSCQTQTGEVRSRGFEAEVVATLVQGLSLTASYTAMNVEVTKSNQGNIGNVPIITPEEMTSIFADYTFHSGPLKGFGLGGGARYIGKSYMDTANRLENDPYTVFDATVHYDLADGTRLAVNAENVFDHEEATCTTAGGCQYISPRIVTGTVRYRW